MNPRPETPATRASDCDVLVIGGGPAGSTAAALLGERGYRVTLLEKAHHPRFHIGESLLPLNMPILQRLGVWEELKEIGIRKNAAEFESHAQNKTVCFEFAEAFDKRWPFAFQVRRSEFDHMLLRNSARFDMPSLSGSDAASSGKLGSNPLRNSQASSIPSRSASPGRR